MNPAFPPNGSFVYEVNLTIQSDVFNKNKAWLIQHFHEMVVENEFIQLNLFFEKNTNPIDDNHLRFQKIIAQYYSNDYEQLEHYFNKQAKKMRSQVVERLGYQYTVSRRVYELVETYVNEDLAVCG